MKNSKKAFHEQVAENLIEQLKQGTAPWQKPWQPGDPVTGLPHNATSGNRYRGINALQLMSQPYVDTRWMTYKQATALGAQVNKGEKGTLIQYWKFNDERIKKDDNGKPVLNEKKEPIKEKIRLERPRVFYATVFNAEQIDGLLPLIIKTPEWEPLVRAEQILQASNAVIEHGEFDRAFYRPATDSIHLPHKNQFETPDRYYATALHELGHWSGHETRLARDLSNPFGSEAYAKEELRAEIASMLLGSELGIGHDPGQHAAYVNHWIKALQEDPNEIFRAAADAEKIQDFVLSLAQEQEIVAREEVKVNQVNQQAAAYTSQLSPDVATVATQNLAAFNELTTGLPKNELYAMLLVSDAHKFYRNGSIDNLEFEETAQDKLGFNIPADWNGRIQIQGNAIRQEANGDESVVSADSLDVEPQFYGVYALRDDNTFQWLKDVDTEKEAKDLTGRLSLIDAASEKNEYEKAIKLARINEERVRHDPQSKAEDISAANEQRQSTESIAMSKDQVNQTKLRELENKPVEKPKQKAMATRQFLAVPYKEKDLAKAAGANWDNTAKAWFVGENADIRALQRWLPENVAKSQTPAMRPEVEFSKFLRSHGCVLDSNHPVMDGSTQRIKLVDDKKSAKTGFYVAHTDGHPAGYFKNNRSGEEVRWKSKGYALTNEQKADLSAQAAINKQSRMAAQHMRQKEVADAIKVLLAMAPVASSEHLYLKNKNARPDGLKLVPGNAAGLPRNSIIKIGKNRSEAKQLREVNPESIVFTAGDLLLPVQDINNEIWSVQTIQPNGTKYFATGSKKEGNFYVVNGANNIAALETTPAIVIAEGYATADTLSQALGQPVVAAFDSGNLSKVATELHDKYPGKPIIIAADDDHVQEAKKGKNPGKEKAEEAAALVNGTAILPIFAPSEKVSSGLSDFNDLGNGSKLGSSAVKRQVQPVIDKAIVEAKRQQIQDQLKTKKIKRVVSI